MKIAIDESPIAKKEQVKHRVRGVGFYIKNLKSSLETHFPKEEFIFFTEKKDIPSDVSVVHYPYFEPFFLSLPYVNHFKTVVTIHDLTPLVFPEYFPSGVKGRIKWEIQKRILRQTERVIADSVASKNDIIKFTGFPSEKIDVVYLAASEQFRPIVQKDLLTNAKKRYNLPDEFVLYVGDVTWNKNLPRLVHAIQQVRMPLVLVGKTLNETNVDLLNPWNQDLVMVQNTVKDDPLFIRLGFVPEEDLPLLYNLATVFVMPSLYEGFGLPILEAMGCGTPVVTTKEGSIPEVAGEGAYFVNAYGTKSIAEGILTVVRNKKLQESLKEKGLKQSSKFSWAKTAKETFQSYKHVTGT